MTGYGEIGGSALGFTDRLENVQCEVCHGPGSKHVATVGMQNSGLDAIKSSIRLAPKASLCTHCHNEKHSDTFEFEAYLRDVLGQGHGAARREALGPGPTAAELRAAAQKRAKADHAR